MSPIDTSLSMAALVHAHTSPVTTFQLSQGWESDQTTRIKALRSSHDELQMLTLHACMHARSHEPKTWTTKYLFADHVN